MTPVSGGYDSWRAVERALKAVAVARANATGTDANRHLRAAYLDRVLCRVFSSSESSEWMLKGGTSMLARVPLTRTTKDLDLWAPESDLDTAEAALRAVLARDLGDHLTVTLSEGRPIVAGEEQADVSGRKFHVELRTDEARSKRLIRFPVDLVVEHRTPVGQVQTVEPTNRLHLPKGLQTATYRLYPLADQVAEKVTAGMRTYAGRASTRTKDLVDLVVIARTQRLEYPQLRAALQDRLRAAELTSFTTYTPPASWGPDYARLSATVPVLRGVQSMDAALRIVRSMVDPAIRGDLLTQHTWLPDTGWTGELGSSRDESQSPPDPERDEPGLT